MKTLKTSDIILKSTTKRQNRPQLIKEKNTQSE